MTTQTCQSVRYTPNLIGRVSILIAFTLFSLGCVSASGELMNVYTVSVDISDEKQEIDNFGASDAWSMQKIGAWSIENRTRMADLLFSKTKGIGLSCWRFNIGAGLDHENIPRPWRTAETFEVSEGKYDWTRQANERWFLAAAKERGVEEFVAFANSPTKRMTRNGRTSATDKLGSINLKDGYEQQYARYLADVLAHFRDNPDPAQRINFDWISPVNEPEWDWNESWQEGTRASNDDIKAITRALGKELRNQNLDTKILLVEAGVFSDMFTRSDKISDQYGKEYGNYLKALCDDPEIAPLMGGTIGWHGYWRDLVPAHLIPARKELRAKLDAYPDWKFWQSEYCVMQGSQDKGGRGRDLGMETALDVARVIHHDLSILGVSAWQWWTAVSPENYKDGLIFTDYQKAGDPETIIPSKLLWAFGNYSRFVRPGDVRIALTGANDVHGLLGSAYKDPDNQKLVLVFLNMSDKPAELTLQITGIAESNAPKTYTPYVTSEKHDLEKQDAIAADKPFTLMPRSVTTLVARRPSNV